MTWIKSAENRSHVLPKLFMSNKWCSCVQIRHVSKHCSRLQSRIRIRFDQKCLFLFLCLRYGSVPAAHHVPVTVSSCPAVLRPSHALPWPLHLLHQSTQRRHRGSQRDGCSCLHPLHHLPASAVPRKPEPELALPDQLVSLPPVLRHRLRLLPVLYGSYRWYRREHGRRALAHSHADFLHGSRRSFGVRRWSRRPDRWQRWRGGWRQPQQLTKCHEHTGTNGRVCLEALLS